MELSLPMSSASTIAEPARNSRRVSIRRVVIMRKELFSPRRRKTPGVSSTSARPSSVLSCWLSFPSDLEFQACIDQAVGNHAERAVLAEAQENAGSQQHLRASFLGFELLVFLHFRKNAEFGLHQLVAQVNLAFHVVDQPGAGRDYRGLGQGGNTASREGQNAKS